MPSAPDALAVASPREPWALPSRVGGPLEPLRRDLAAAGADRGLAVWIGPGVAARFGVDEDALRRLAPALSEALDRGDLHPPTFVDDPFARPWPLGSAQDGDAARWPTARPDAVLPDAPTLYLVAAGLETRRWRARPAEVSGSCAPALAALGHAQGQALAQLRPFIRETDRRLAGRFVARLTERTGPATPAETNTSPGPECAAQLAELDAMVRTCRTSPDCELAPRLGVSNSLIVSVPVRPDACGEVMADGGDLEGAVRAAQAQAAADVTATLDPGWTELADRSAALVAVHEHVARSCEPRRRRFTATDDEALASSMRSLLERLGAPRVTPRPVWDDAPAVFHVPGRGKVIALQTVETALAQSVRRGAARLEGEVYARARCTGPFEEDPLAVVLVIDGEVRASHFVYPEQLYCPELDE